MKHLLLLSFFAFVFVACSAVQQDLIYTSEQSKNYGFTVSADSKLQNPPAKKARVYIIRRVNVWGDGINSAIGANVYYQYNPEIVKVASVETPMLERDKYIGNSIGYLSSGARLQKDFDGGKSLLLITSETNIVFTPEAGKIYCVERQKSKASKGVFRLIDKARCEKIYAK